MNPNSSAVSAQTSTSPLGHHHGASNEINKFYMSSLLNLNHDGMANMSEPAGVCFDDIFFCMCVFVCVCVYKMGIPCIVGRYVHNS